MKKQSQKRILKSLLDISGFTSYVDTPDLILSLIIEECVLTTRAKWGAILFFSTYRVVDSFQITKPVTEKEKSLLSSRLERVVGEIVSEKGDDAMLQPDLWQKKDVKKRIKIALDIKNELIAACPIMKKNEFLGLAVIAGKKGARGFSRDDNESFDIICREASIVLDNIRLFKTKLQNERMAAIGQTMAGISHYVKNILQGITSGSYLINTGINQNDMTSIKTAWGVVSKNTKRISDLVMDMLYYTKDRITSKQQLDPVNLVNDISKLVEPTLANRGIKFRLKLDDLPDEIEANEKGLHRSILNIILNAADACDKDNSLIKFTAYSDKPRRSVVMIIEDNGKGMSKETKEKIFLPFYTEKSKGTGLGLAITEKIIEEHGGSIRVDSEIDKGTTFEIVIPVTCRKS